MRQWNEKGASMVEYALLVVLIAIVAMIALALLGQNIAQLFQNVGDQIPGGATTTIAP
jgi:pilus assembly protein Flp/PilA